MPKNKKAYEVFFEIENIIHSMSQECVTSINLLNESIEIYNSDSLKIIDSIRDDLNENQLVIDKMIFNLLNSDSIEDNLMRSLWYYTGIASEFENMGKYIMNIVVHLRRIFVFIDDFSNIKEFLIYNSYIKNMVAICSNTFLDKNVGQIKSLLTNGNKKIEDKKNEILSSMVKAMKTENQSLFSLYTELIFMVKNLYYVGRCVIEVAQKMEDNII